MEREGLKTYVEATAEDQGLWGHPCRPEGPIDPCLIVIIGASGDLTARKLLPALFNLSVQGGLPDPCLVVGAGRTPMDIDSFRASMKQALNESIKKQRAGWEAFARCLFYYQLDYEDPSTYAALGEYLDQLDRTHGIKGNRIFYLALPPVLYETVAERLGANGLAGNREGSNGWVRLVLEKPFGRDLSTAVRLDRSLHRHFQEAQIFRIDHYLAKETVQNIMIFRFANAIFEPLWNRRYIDSVNITAAETLGVEHRAGYYDQAGVLRDMFQNHMMQLLALTAMEPPSLFEPDRVLDEKSKLYRALRPFPVEELWDYLVLGQYDAGIVEGRSVRAYRTEPGVPPDSLTPTFAMMKIFVDNWRWQGVPFYLTSGKRLAEKRTDIIIQFKEVPHSMFRQLLGDSIAANRLILGISPEERLTLTFQTKVPGARVCLRSVTMDFHYHQGYLGPLLEAYEKVLLDVLLGDRMLFWRQDGVELCWAFLTPILEECESCSIRTQMLLPYRAGTWGPEEAGKIRQQTPVLGA